MEDFKKSSKMQCFKEGGSVKYKSRHSEKSEMSEDIAQDKKVIKKAFAMHDKQEHKGEKTDLSNLKKGGRAKKEVGTVKKFKTGGAVENAYGAKKTDKDIKDIANSKRQKPALLCGGKSVRKMADGGDVDPYDIGGGALQSIGKVPLVGGALKAGATDFRNKVLGTPEQNRIAQAQMDKVKARKAAEAAAMAGGLGGARALQQGAMAGAMSDKDAAMMGRKKGGKVKKYASGGSIEEAWSKGNLKPVPMPQLGGGKPRTMNIDGREVEMKPVPMPQLGGGKPRTMNIDGREIEMKPIPMPPHSNKNLGLMKKGGKVKKACK